jgi:transcriptional regulator with PAS, ATPase and Fis domain
VLAATHRNIPEMIEAGTFREDLYYRLNVLQVKTPPLRDRPDDIEPLIAHFVEKICVKLGIDRTIQRTAIERLKAYSWPGNVRQLEGEIESHLARCEGSEVTVEQLDAKFFKAQPQSDAPPTTLKELEAALETAKQAHILKAVEESKTKAEAAKKLGISPSLLQFYLARRPSREAAGS